MSEVAAEAEKDDERARQKGYRSEIGYGLGQSVLSDDGT